MLLVPTGLKVFNSQEIYLISFTKTFRSKKSSIQDLLLPKKKLSFKEVGSQGIVSHRFRETNNEKKFGSKNILDSKENQIDLTCHNLTSSVLT